MCRVTIKHAVLIVAAIFLALSCAAQTISTVPESVDRYERDMNVAKSSSVSVSLEKVFEDGILAAEALEYGQLERFDQATYQKVKRMMIGFWVTREEVILADPDPSYFLKLAREKGTKADQAFFEVLKKTYPEGSWAVYMKRITDYGGCFVFDGETLSETYGLWASFQKTNSSQYQSAVRRELARIRSALESDCVCGGEETYRQELQSFLTTYSTSPFKPVVASRLDAIIKKTVKMRFNCEPH